MRLTELLGDAAVPQPRDVEIAGLSTDSRAVKAGYLFAALAGTKTDGARFIKDAVDKGAIAVLAPPGTELPDAQVVLVADANPRRRLALMAARFYGAQPATIAAVTGTNGKTSVAHFARHLWESLGYPAASLGTLGVRASGFEVLLAHTTPDPVTLHRLLADLKGRSIDHLAIEASSHGLDQYRLDGVRIQAAAFTNLTRDHMDYHPTTEAYFAAKMRLFDILLPAGGVAVVNADSDYFAAVAAICTRRGHRLFSYGERGREVRVRNLTLGADGLKLDVDLLGTPRTVDLALAGAFQAGNALCALGLVIGCGAPADKAWAALANIEGAPGRMQLVARTKFGAGIYVDYAHTPDALETVLRALRPHVAKRLALVFGCGGDRDRGKRPMMGAIAARLADRIYVTDDNPRGEAAASIRAEILAACPGAREIGDRAQAIAQAVAELESGDILVLAGKGHEQGQIVGTLTLPFDDAQAARAALASGRR